MGEKERTLMNNISVKGFKSINSMVDYRPQPVNILIGSNGSGKSNFLSLFSFLKSANNPTMLSQYIAINGGAHRFLFDGPKITDEISISIGFGTAGILTDYYTSFSYTADDNLAITGRSLRVLDDNGEAAQLGQNKSFVHGKTAEAAYRSLEEHRSYQFQDTTFQSRLKQKWSIDDNISLKRDGGNLASILLRLKSENEDEYDRIRTYSRTLFPFFDDFVLEIENDEYILLRWKEVNSDLVFNVAEASDGMLRLWCLLAVFCSPRCRLPSVIILDEPELGLHPAAIELVASLIRQASAHTQIFIATQSPTFVDHFSPEEITVVERQGRESIFKQLNQEELKDWLKDYSLGDLWQKNVIGGNPFR